MGFSVSETLGEAWGLYTRNSGRLILIAGTVFALLSLLYIAVDVANERTLAIVSAGVTVLGVLSLQGALTVFVDDLRARRAQRSIGDLFGAVSPVLWVLLGAELIATVGIVGGLILFLVPGLVLLTIWSGIIPAIVLERRGVLECFRRSMDLVSGNFLKVLAVIVITIVLGTVVATVIGLALSPLPRYADFYISSVVANAVTMPYVAVAWTVMFFELRLAKEGPQ
jgi:hypothetical protein